jgi:hypothetical protein
VNKLAAWLLRTAKQEELAGRSVPDLLGELAQCCHTKVLARCDQSFGDSPDTLIPATPKWAARMSEQ